MGILPASKIFLQKIMKFFDIEYVKMYVGELYIEAPQEIHDRTLAKVLQRAIENGIIYYENQFQFRKPSVKILGFDVSANGIRINDHNNINAITAMKHLQTYLARCNISLSLCQTLLVFRHFLGN